jgi:hypothetical protein
MRITYAPEDGDRQEWDFDPDRVRSSLAEMIERKYGETWEQFCAGVQSGNMRARRVLLWHLLRLEHPALRYEDVPDFYASELKVQYSVAELNDIRDRLQKMHLPETQRDSAMAALDVEMTSAMEREEGKAPSASSVTTGGLPSPPS